MSLTSTLAGIGKSIQATEDQIDKAQSKAFGTDKLFKVPPSGMKTHVAVEHGYRPPLKK